MKSFRYTEEVCIMYVAFVCYLGKPHRVLGSQKMTLGTVNLSKSICAQEYNIDTEVSGLNILNFSLRS